MGEKADVEQLAPRVGSGITRESVSLLGDQQRFGDYSLLSTRIIGIETNNSIKSLSVCEKEQHNGQSDFLDFTCISSG